jgi:hypothetical protein
MNDPRINIKQIPELAQRQDSEFAQFQDAKVVCTRLGMYDAADAIQRHLDKKSDTELLQSKLRRLSDAVELHLAGKGQDNEDRLKYALEFAGKIEDNSTIEELESRLKTLTAACYHFLSMATPVQGSEARMELMKVVQAVGTPVKKKTHVNRQEALQEREVAIEGKFDEFWRARSELFKKQFTSSSIARDLWEHAVELCQDVPKV